ncbi:MAG: hypothetical protein AAF526_11065 [Pseudomonadota bacterium]
MGKRSRFEGRPREMLRDATGGKTVEVDLIYLRRAGQAVVFETAEETEKLLPASQISFEEEVDPGDAVVVTVPVWLAQQEGLV